MLLTGVGAGGMLQFAIIWGLFLAVMYFMVMRPQKKEQKRLAAMLSSLEVGDVVVIPANVKHWHGAKKHCWFSHIAVEVPGENTSNEWCEEVIDEEYDKL